jgi:hypothetical protein
MDVLLTWLAHPTLWAGVIAGLVACVYAIIAGVRAVRTIGEQRIFYLLLSYHLVEPLLTLAFRLSEVFGIAWAFPSPQYYAPAAASLPMYVLLVPLMRDWQDATLRRSAERLAILGAARCVATLAFVVLDQSREFRNTELVGAIVVLSIALLWISIGYVLYVLVRMQSAGSAERTSLVGRRPR